MQNLNKKNFFDEVREQYPEAVDAFCVYVDKYKERTGWNEMFGGGMTRSPKFHEIPYEMQFGILLSFFNNKAGTMFLQPAAATSFFREMFRIISKGQRVPEESVGCVMINMERAEHITKHKFDADHDKSNNNGELIKCALYLLLDDNSFYPDWWDKKWMEHFSKKTKIEKWVIAGSLIAAAIDQELYDDLINDRDNKNSSLDNKGETIDTGK